MTSKPAPARADSARERGSSDLTTTTFRFGQTIHVAEMAAADERFTRRRARRGEGGKRCKRLYVSRVRTNTLWVYEKKKPQIKSIYEDYADFRVLLARLNCRLLHNRFHEYLVTGMFRKFDFEFFAVFHRVRKKKHRGLQKQRVSTF